MDVLPLEALPVGYRFSPTDEELIDHFLRSKITGNEEAVRHIPVVDLCKLEPWDLPDMSLIKTNDDKWIFLCPKECNYSRSKKRSKRATRAGYWKSTGKKRSIKSVNGTTKIGTKTTLVFYAGRAGKGQKRTNWVIHEYCATSKDLDGTTPGQGSFVLLKLIKKKLDRKQDKSAEGANGMTLDPPVPTESRVADNAGNKSIVQDGIIEDSNGATLDTHSPIESCFADNAGEKLIVQDEITEGSNQTTLDTSLPTESCVADNAGDKSIVQDEITECSNGTTLDTSLPTESCVAYNAGDKSIVQDEVTEGSNGTTLDTSLPTESCVAYNAGDKSIVQPDHDAEVWRHLPEPSMEPPDFFAIFFPPLQSQMRQELESLQNPISNNVGPDHNGVLFPYGTDDQYITSSDPEGSSSNSYVVSNDDTFATGIELPTRQTHDQPDSQNFGTQGNAPRRLGLQKKLHLPSFYSSNFRDLSFKDKNHEAKLVLAKAEEADGTHAEEAEQKHRFTADPAAIIDETRDTSPSKSNDVSEVAQELAWNMKSRSDFRRVGDKDVPSASLKTPALLSVFSSMRMLGALLAVLSIVFVGLRRYLEF